MFYLDPDICLGIREPGYWERIDTTEEIFYMFVMPHVSSNKVIKDNGGLACINCYLDIPYNRFSSMAELIRGGRW